GFDRPLQELSGPPRVGKAGGEEEDFAVVALLLGGVEPVAHPREGARVTSRGFFPFPDRLQGLAHGVGRPPPLLLDSAGQRGQAVEEQRLDELSRRRLLAQQAVEETDALRLGYRLQRRRVEHAPRQLKGPFRRRLVLV